jgi:hypothetical protein
MISGIRPLEVVDRLPSHFAPEPRHVRLRLLEVNIGIDPLCAHVREMRAEECSRTSLDAPGLAGARLMIPVTEVAFASRIKPSAVSAA